MRGVPWVLAATLFVWAELSSANPAGGKVVVPKPKGNSGGSGGSSGGGGKSGRQRREVDVAEATEWAAEARLPQAVTPLCYRLSLTPDLPHCTVAGRVNIRVSCVNETDTIVLHAHNLVVVSEVTLRELTSGAEGSRINHPLNYKGPHGEAATPVPLARYSADPQNQKFIINVAERLKLGHEYELTLDFQSSMSGANEGLFRGSYMDHRTKGKREFAATQLRPSKARRVFPCFDEPAFKVPFSISVARPEGLRTLSNMPVERSESSDGNLVWDHFQKTPPMSTYSVGLLLSDLEFVAPNVNGTNKVSVRVFGRAHYLSQLQAAADLVPASIDVLEAFLGMPYPLPKIDLVALPHYSAEEPADSWGLVMFRESDLVGELVWKVTNALAYQWVGHLTSPSWWDQAHVNRALANYITYAAMQQLKPQDCPTWGKYYGYTLYYQYAKRHPFANLGSQEEIVRAGKTQWLLRMLNYTLTEEKFKTGLQQFLENRKFKGFTDADLWSSLATQGGLEGVTLEEVAKSWTSQDRYPVVSVARDYYSNTATFGQNLFLRDRPHDVPNKDAFTWYIPIMYIQPDSLDVSTIRPVAWMKGDRQINVPGFPEPEKYIIVNPDDIGMFLVNYDPSNWALLVDALTQETITIPVATRAKLLHDAWNLAYGGVLDFGTALNLTRFLRVERDPAVWDVFFTMVDHVGRHIAGTAAARKFEDYTRRLLNDLRRRLNETVAEDDPKRHEFVAMTNQVLNRVTLEHYVEEARPAFARWMESDDPDSGSPVADKYLCPVFKWGSAEEWEFALQRVISFPAGRQRMERSYLLRTLAGCPRQPEKVERILNVTILEGNGNFSDADIRLVLSMLTGDSIGYTTLFKFVRQNWDMVKKRFDGKPHMWEYLIHCATEVFKTQEGLDLVSELYVERHGEFGSAEPVIERALKTVKEEARWSEENLPVMEAWLDLELEQMSQEEPRGRYFM